MSLSKHEPDFPPPTEVFRIKELRLGKAALSQVAEQVVVQSRGS